MLSCLLINNVVDIHGSLITVALLIGMPIYISQMLTFLQSCECVIYAANGSAMRVTGCGAAGTFPNVLYLSNLQANLFSQKQVMREGATISLSSDGKVFTVTTSDDRVMRFIFDGTLWKWTISCLRVLLQPPHLLL